MKRAICVVALVLVFGCVCLAQSSGDDAPATAADVATYFETIHSHDMVKKMMAAMTQSMHQMWREEYLKHKDTLPADYEAKMTANMDNMFENMPWDEIIQASAPVYEKHFTRGDINELLAFYSSPVGQKMLREMPVVMSESLQIMTPIIQRYVESVQQKLQKETDDLIMQSKKPATVAPATHD